MSYSFGSRLRRREDESRTLSSALRSAGRVALWAAVGLLLIRGAVGLLGPAGEPEPAAHQAGGELDPAGSTFAIRFARTYLEARSRQALAPFLAAGAEVGSGRPPSVGGAQVAQAEVVRSMNLGDGRAVVTVACELRGSRTLYLAVPIVRHAAGEVAALGAPSIVAVPAVAGADPERPQPLAGSGAAQIKELITKFLPAYLSARESSELSYYLAPGAQVVPLGGAIEPIGSPRVTQIGEGAGPRREVIASQRVREPVSGAGYPLAYRLRVVERAGRWYVATVEGALA